MTATVAAPMPPINGPKVQATMGTDIQMEMFAYMKNGKP